MFVAHSLALEDIVEEVVSNINEITLIPRAIRYRIQIVKSFAIPKVMSKASLIPVSSEPLKKLIAELRQAEPHTHHAGEKMKETHELIFSWLSWLAGIARGRERTTTTTTAELPNMAAILPKRDIQP